MSCASCGFLFAARHSISGTEPFSLKDTFKDLLLGCGVGVGWGGGEGKVV